MGLVAKLLSFARVTRNDANVSDVKADPGGGPNVTAEHFAAPGDDAHPLPGDYPYLAPTQQRGRFAAVGYVDPKNEQKAQPGERRLYARDAETGEAVFEIWIKADGSGTLSNANGSVTLDPDGGSSIVSPSGAFTVAADGYIGGANESGSFELLAGGNFVVNGVTIDTSGNISGANTIEASSTIKGAGITDTANNVTLGTHIHEASGSPTTPPTPGT